MRFFSIENASERAYNDRKGKYYFKITKARLSDTRFTRVLIVVDNLFPRFHMRYEEDDPI